MSDRDHGYEILLAYEINNSCADLVSESRSWVVFSLSLGIDHAVVRVVSRTNPQSSHLSTQTGAFHTVGIDIDPYLTMHPEAMEEEKETLELQKRSSKLPDTPETALDNEASTLLMPTVSWTQQWITIVRYKTLPLLSRRPLLLVAMLTSSVVSVLLSWPVGQDYDITAPTDGTCGGPDLDFLVEHFQNNEDYSTFDIPASISDRWQQTLPLLLLSLGPLVFAFLVYLVVHEEIQSRLFRVLRGLGTRDSVYWMSWFIPFAVIALASSLLGAITAQFIPVHVYRSVYFGGIFAALWFVHLALISASLLAAAISGTSKRVVIVWTIALLVAAVAPWIATQTSTYPETAAGAVERIGSGSPGLFWYHRTTADTDLYSQFYWNDDDTPWNKTANTCQDPILSVTEGNNYKLPEEQLQVPTKEFFLGCFAQAGTAAQFWNLQGPAKLGTIALYLLPYFHLHSIFGNFLGFTADQNQKFTAREASLSAAQLANRMQNVDNPQSTFHFRQGAMLILKDGWKSSIPCAKWERDSFGYEYCAGQKSNCVANSGFGLCNGSSQCYSGRLVDSPSINSLLGHLFLLAILYLLLAAYWGIVFVAGTERFYFPFQVGYWMGMKNIPAASSDDVEIDAVRKSYGSVEAVKGVSLKLKRGEITALLGHNGAGKTTLSNMLTCETLPSSGDMCIMGKSVKRDSYAVRRMVGVCRQDDFLWPNLTAKEHLFLFAGLCGVSEDLQGVTVQKWLESVDLELVQDHFSKQFSGGMKRRLSLALSTIGGRPFIVLDEPTTGMDPVSRQFVWRHVDAIKKDRIVLLTTHSMEEADLLSDQVAIMKGGELAAVGTSLQLKAEHGTALQFHILTVASSVVAARDAIESMFSGAHEYVNIKANSTGNIRVNVVKIKQEDDESDVGVHVNDLQEFVKWLEDEASPVQEYGFSNSSLEEVFLRITEDEPAEQSHVPGANMTGDGESVVANAENLSNQTTAMKEVATFSTDLSLSAQLDALSQHHIKRSWTGRRSSASWALLALTTTISGFVLVMSSRNSSSGGHFSFLAPIVSVSLVLLTIASSMHGDRSDGLFYLMRSQGLLSSAYSLSYVFYSLLLGVTFSLLVFTLCYATPLFRDPEPCFNDCWRNRGLFSRPIAAYPPQISLDIGDLETALDFEQQPLDQFGSQGFSLQAYSSPSGYGFLLLTALLFGTTFPGITLASSYLPGNNLATITTAVLLLSSCFAPLVGVRYLADEELDQCLRRMAPTHNCSQWIFSIDNVTEDFLNCVGSEVTRSGEFGSLCQPSIAGMLPQFAVFQELTAALAGRITFISNPPSFVEDELIPRLVKQGQRCDTATCNFPYARKLYWETVGYEVLGSVMLLLIGVFGMSVFRFPPDSILRLKRKLRGIFSREKQQTGSHEEQELHELKEVTQERELVEKTMHDFIEKTSDGVVRLNGNDIPRAEMPPVIMHRLKKVYPAVGKVPPKHALNSLDLHVSKGQILGLLGKNGAGKTTALKILAGAHESSNGVGLVAGYDVDQERLDVFSRLGNCAQFDKIWPRLSVKEHLVFFSRLKGVPKARVQQAARDIATAVGLGTSEVYNRAAGDLSGGMRRRLSIAIALVSAPKALLLDEPSTGLDPATRANIWALIGALSNEDRGIILTTHQMIEADTLCDRIAIMAKGQLVVVATQQYLKDNFGSGYVLQINLVHKNPETESLAMEFCRCHLHKDAFLSRKQAKTLHIGLPADLDLRRVFAALYDPKIRPDYINQFLLNQSSLEQVFLALGDGAVDEGQTQVAL